MKRPEPEQRVDQVPKQVAEAAQPPQHREWDDAALPVDAAGSLSRTQRILLS